MVRLKPDATSDGNHLEAVDRGDVRMVQRGQRLRLALEPRQAVRVSGEHVGQDLDRHLAAEHAGGPRASRYNVASFSAQ